VKEIADKKRKETMDQEYLVSAAIRNAFFIRIHSDFLIGSFHFIIFPDIRCET